MFSLPIKSVMDRKKVLTAPPQTCVAKAAELMAKKNVGAVMVVEDELLIGIFTERDAVFRVIAQGRDVHTTRLAEVMTPSPLTVSAEKPFAPWMWPLAISQSALRSVLKSRSHRSVIWMSMAVGVDVGM